MYNTKPVPNEEKYVELDEDTGLYCVFGTESGFAYSSHADYNDAKKALTN